MVRAGPRRHWITIKAPVFVTAPSGDVTVERWTFHAEAFAKIRTPTANEQENAEQSGHVATHVVELPFVEGVTSQMRVEHEGGEWQITGVRDIEARRVEMHLDCIEADHHRGTE